MRNSCCRIEDLITPDWPKRCATRHLSKVKEVFGERLRAELSHSHAALRLCMLQRWACVSTSACCCCRWLLKALGLPIVTQHNGGLLGKTYAGLLWEVRHFAWDFFFFYLILILLAFSCVRFWEVGLPDLFGGLFCYSEYRWAVLALLDHWKTRSITWNPATWASHHSGKALPKQKHQTGWSYFLIAQKNL